MFLKSDPHRMHKIGNDKLMQLIYATKDSWNQAKETKQAVYESDVDSELNDRAKLRECKYMYLYKKARQRKAHGHLNGGVIQH